MIHELKVQRKFYVPLIMGYKKVELRKADRPFEVGDILLLHEIDEITELRTGRSVEKQITHIVKDGPWLSPGYWALSIGDIKRSWIEVKRK